jgi:hypothetical protein
LVIDAFLNVLPFDERARLATTLGHVSQVAPAPFLVVGSIAVRYHLHRLGYPPSHRALHDLDLAVSGVDSLPSIEGEELLVSHYHPESAISGTGRMLLQLVDEETRLRIDIFHALAGAMDRASPLEGCSSLIFVASIEDMLVRSLLVLRGQVQSGMAVAKHVETIQQLSEMVDGNSAEQLWARVRQVHQLESIQAAVAHAEGLPRGPSSLDAVDEYGQLDDPPCEVCVSGGRYPLADKQRIFDILGYI